MMVSGLQGGPGYWSLILSLLELPPYGISSTTGTEPWTSKTPEKLTAL